MLTLNATVATLNTNVDVLKTDGEAKSKVIGNQTASIHKVYYATGTSKELEGFEMIT